MGNRGLVESGFVYEKYAEDKHVGMRLGRNQWLDGRSLAYMVENDAREMGGGLHDQHWDRVLAILDQGQLGSCTGNAGTGALGTQPLYDAVGKPVLPANDAVAAEQFAVQLYADATVADGYPGTYPPDDTGSSGLAVCKVLKARGVVSGYRWHRVADGAENEVFTIVEDGSDAPADPRGAGGQRTFVLEAARPGTAILRLEKSRSWESGAPVEQFSVTVDVQP